MSITAKLLYIGLKLSGIKKKYTLPEAAFLAEVRKMNKNRGFFVPNNKKAIYQTHEVLGHKCLIVQTKETPAARAILYFFGGGMIHCYAILPYFKEAKADFDEIVRILAA